MSAKFEDYRVEIRALTAAEDGGFLATFPDLPGCLADGESPETAIADARDACASWMAAHIEDGRAIPKPGGTDAAPVRFVQRLPRSVHAALKSLAASDGVSIDTMATVLIAEGIGSRTHG